MFLSGIKDKTCGFVNVSKWNYLLKNENISFLNSFENVRLKWKSVVEKRNQNYLKVTIVQTINVSGNIEF